MKSMEEYISEVYEKYNELERQNIKYKTIKMKRKNPMISLCGVVACVLLAIFVGVNIKDKLPIVDEKPIEFVSNESGESGDIIYTKYLKIDSVCDLNNLIDESDAIAIISDFEFEDVRYDNKKNRFMLKTIGNVKIQECFKGEKELEKLFIKCSRNFGMISLSKLEKNTDYNWSEWELEYIGKQVPESEKEKTYYKQLPTKGVEIEADRQYLAFLKYDSENEIYEIWDMAYGVMEYDPNTDMIKNIDTGEFEKLDRSLFENK